MKIPFLRPPNCCPSETRLAASAVNPLARGARRHHSAAGHFVDRPPPTSTCKTFAMKSCAIVTRRGVVGAVIAFASAVDCAPAAISATVPAATPPSAAADQS